MIVDGLRYSIDGPVATITIDREEKRNALAPRHFEGLIACLRQADTDPDVRVLILTGTGEKAFCAGADLSPEGMFLTSIAAGGTTGLGNVLRTARKLTKPLVARVNGPCYAGGVGLLAACDIVIAAEGARIALPEVKHGLFPHVVLAGWRARLPAHTLFPLALTGEPISMSEAARIGVVSTVVAQAALDTAVSATALRLARLPTGLFPKVRCMSSLLDDTAFEAALARAEAETCQSALKIPR